MVVKKCHDCNMRYTIQPNMGDYVHNCADFNPSPAIANEDVVIMETLAEDFDGTHIRGPVEVMYGGVYNQFQGTDAGLEGDNFDGVTRRGNNILTHRTRRKFKYIEKPEEY
jgi:hypothetical protein